MHHTLRDAFTTSIVFTFMGILSMKKHILDRYAHTPDNKFIIDIAAGKVEDIYNDFDKYTPYVKKELDDDLVEYILVCVNELFDEDFVLQFNISAKADGDAMSRVEKSIHNYFLYRKGLELSKLKDMNRSSLIRLLMGVGILALSAWNSEILGNQDSVLRRVFVEGLTVAAWVSLWEALANFLVNRGPNYRKIKMFDRLIKAPVLFSWKTLDNG